MAKEKQTLSGIEEIRAVRIQKGDRIRSLGFHPYSNTYHPTHTARQVREICTMVGSHQAAEGEGSLGGGLRFGVAGRVLAIRSFGKAAFFHLMDGSGTIQIYVRKDKVSASDFEIWSEVDTGDFVGIEGPAFRTKTGELTLQAERIHFLTKALRPLPEKWHGLRDPESRYRQRYLDLLSNSHAREIFLVRSVVLASLREYLSNEGFIEVETPMLHPLQGGATARPFVTRHNVLGRELFLRVAPELYLKRLLVGGLDKVFEIGKAFRNEGVSSKHNPEFTILEFYEAYSDYEKVLRRAEEMIRLVERRVHERFPNLREKRGYDLQAPWRKATMKELLCEHGKGEGITLEVVENEELCRRWYEATVPEQERTRQISHGEIVFMMFEKIVEPRIGPQPLCVIDFPRSVSPLARPKDSNPFWVDRFEVYLDGREIINAFSELNDPKLQAEAFAAQAAERAGGNEEAMDYDHDYITALEHGMPPAGGFGLGVDRLVMSLCHVDSIREVILFPAMRPEQGREMARPAAWEPET